MESEMDVEKAVAPAGADERRREEQVERLLKKVRRYSAFLHFGSMIVGIAPRFAPPSRPAFVPCLPAGYDLLATCASFAVATLVVQRMLARVLERRSPAPAPAAPRLTPQAAWPLGILTWMLLTLFFVSYLRFGHDYGYFERSSSEWALARLASAANFAMATSTVKDHLGLDEDIIAAPTRVCKNQRIMAVAGVSIYRCASLFVSSSWKFSSSSN